MLLPVAVLLGGIAALYGLGALVSLLLRAFRLFAAGHRMYAARCILFAALIAAAALLFNYLVFRGRPNSWLFLPQDIPFYIMFTAACHYLANVVPRKWHPQHAASAL